MPGNDMLARIAIGRLPSDNTTGLPVLMSVATARNGIGRSSKRPLTRPAPVARSNRAISFSPSETPPASATALPSPPSPMPIGASWA